MKWKCAECIYGPCVYESACDDNIAVITEKCPRAFHSVVWKIMSDEKPERDDETGLPEWLKVGNFIRIRTRPVFRIDGYDRDTNTFAVSYKNIFGRSEKSENFHIKDFSTVRQVFPKPYTFETAPLLVKAQMKRSGEKDFLRLYMSCKGDSLFHSSRLGLFVLFEDVLRDYETLDGWPVRTFEEEEAGNER